MAALDVEFDFQFFFSGILVSNLTSRYDVQIHVRELAMTKLYYVTDGISEKV